MLGFIVRLRRAHQGNCQPRFALPCFIEARPSLSHSLGYVYIYVYRCTSIRILFASPRARCGTSDDDGRSHWLHAAKELPRLYTKQPQVISDISKSKSICIQRLHEERKERGRRFQRAYTVQQATSTFPSHNICFSYQLMVVSHNYVNINQHQHTSGFLKRVLTKVCEAEKHFFSYLG